MRYVEGFVGAVPAANKEAFRKHAAEAAPIFKEFGVTRHVECWGDDVPDGKTTDFRRSVKAEADEVVVFSWLEYPSKEARNAANEKMMSDPRMRDMEKAMPFDGKRMIYGGFLPILDEGKGGRMGYADGMLAAVPTENRDSYQRFSETFSSLMVEFGAMRIVDTWGDDLPDGKVTDYRRAVQAADNETVVYSWIEWPSRQVRDAGWGKLQADPRMADVTMPFDGRRLIYGGFVPILDV
ncbi:MAG TPA: DUF1428 family protein [Xanthobacteraceae bacterium]|nr:DUF1428 family protein [Xanthobacteraceae bacterium]